MASPPILAGNVISFRNWFTQAEQAAVCTTHWLCVSTSGTPTTLQQICDAWDTAVQALWKTLIDSESIYNGTQAYVDQVPLPQFAATTSSAGAGDGAALAVPRQATGLLGWTTSFAGPQFRGRLYLPFPGVDEDASGGIPTNLYRAHGNALGAAIVAFTTVTVGGGTLAGYPCILHRKNKAGTIPPPTQITLGTTRAKFATQKRRGSYGRPNVSPI